MDKETKAEKLAELQNEWLEKLGGIEGFKKFCINNCHSYQDCEYYFGEGCGCLFLACPCKWDKDLLDYSEEEQMMYFNCSKEEVRKQPELGNAWIDYTWRTEKIPDWVTIDNVDNYMEFFWGEKTYDKFWEDWID